MRSASVNLITFSQPAQGTEEQDLPEIERSRGDINWEWRAARNEKAPSPANRGRGF